MNLWLNGDRVEIDDEQTIADLATRLGLAPHTVLIEQNGAALHQREWTERRVRDDDRIEFVRVVAGG